MSIISGSKQQGCEWEVTKTVGWRSGRGTAACNSGRYVTFKVVIDTVLALVLLVLTAPLMLAVVVLVKLTSRGPAFYSQTRLGLNGRPYQMHKIRTMHHNCERLTGPRWSTPGDPRVILVGRFLRKSHLDELPQLWNVLRGEMSLIGPRPERPEIAVSLDRAIAHYRGRLLVRPGLSGLAQVQLPPDTDLASVRLKLSYDLYYVHYVGFLMDLRLIVATGLHLLRVPFAVTRALLRIPCGEVVEEPYQSVLQLEAGAAGYSGQKEPAKGRTVDWRRTLSASDLSKMQEEDLEVLARECGYHPAANELLLRQYALALTVP
jgi:lipopolysaccharide/colanic/teichoic acid biosynthesis glycosyltransferase